MPIEVVTGQAGSVVAVDHPFGVQHRHDLEDELRRRRVRVLSRVSARGESWKQPLKHAIIQGNAE